jgi:gliding motility-associated-like protein
MANAQPCPPPGFPNAGNTCQTAPILCQTLDNYCTEINNNNVSQNFPGCPGFTLNNDEWFGFYAGSTTITMTVIPSNCTPGTGGQLGLQAGIYTNCISGAMDLQCNCSQAPFVLTANNFVVGQVYWMVIDGCAGSVCDYVIDVTAGSTAGQPPANPGPVNGPVNVCSGSTTNYNITPPTGATIYNWTIDPPLGTIAGNSNSINVVWGNTPGTANICVSTANACYANPVTSCKEVTVKQSPTATISGSGVLCQGAITPVDLTINFTGDAPWTFVYRINGVNQPAITTSTNPYTLPVTQAGTYTLASVSNSGPITCTGTVSGNAVVTLTNITSTTSVTNAICGVDNGSVNLTVNGNGNPPYTFSWSGGQTTEDINGVVPGTYTVTITDEDGCTKTAQATVGNNLTTINLSAALTVNTTCINGNGAINLTASPANNGYVYGWSNGETTEDISNLTPGNYVVTVTQGVNCTATASYTIADQPNQPNISGVPTQSTCDQSNGSINMTPSSGVSPYTFNWSNGETTEDLNNLLAGTYDVTVTGANGCTRTASFTVTNTNPPISVSGVTTNNTTCINGNGSINISMVPASNYTFNWSNGETTEDISNLTPGTYQVTVTLVGSCTQSGSFTIDDNPNLPNLNPVVTPSTCELPNGAITVSVSGGVAPFVFEWSNGASSSTTNSLLAGSYQLTVTGANGCTRTADITVPNNNPPFNISGAPTVNTICLPGQGNGSINVSVNPNANYTYEWSHGPITQDVNNLPTGTYTVTVSAGGACVSTAEFTIDENPNPPNLSAVPSESTCDLSNGSVNLTVTGGVPSYSYNWSNGATTQDINGVLAGTYSVVVTGSNGCTAEAEYTIGNNNPPITVTAVVSANTYCGSNTNGAINVTVSPPNAPYTYEWNSGQSSQDLTNLPPGSYDLTVTGFGSCSQTASFEVPDNPNIPNPTYIVTNTKCGLNNGSINLTVQGGLSPHTFEWSSGQSTQNLSNILSGFYSVTVTSANGCSNTADIFVDDESIPITINGIVTNQTSCTTDNGRIVLTVTPANAVVTWDNGSTGTILNNLPPGDYTATATVGASCEEIKTFTISDNTEQPVLSTTVAPALCGLSNGSINLEVTAGITPYSYYWSNFATTQDLNNKPPGTYTVVVTTAAGCTSEATVVIPSDNLAFSINATIVDNSSCGQPNGSVTLSVAPTNPYTYKWSNNTSLPKIQNVAAGTYTVTVTYGLNCTATANYTIQNNPTLPNLATSSQPSTCNLSNGSVEAIASNGTPPFNFLWSNSNPNPIINNLPAGTYTATVTDALNCTAVSTTIVGNNNPPINLSATITENTSCVAGNGTLNLLVDPPGNYTYLWSTSSNAANLSALNPGTYTVTVTAGITCTAIAPFTVGNNTVNPNINPDVTPAVCSQNNGAINLTVTNAPTPYNFSWSNAATTEDLTTIFPGNYTVTVTAANGCSATSILNVANNSTSFSLSAVATPRTNCATPNGAVNLTVTPPGTYTILWSNSASTEDLTGIQPGFYTVTVTEVGTCAATATYIVEDERTYPSSTQIIESEICGLQNGQINLSPTGGTPPYAFNWTGGATTEDLNNMAAGMYNVTITDTNNCTSTASSNIPGNSVSFAVNGIATPNTSCVTNNGSINLSVLPPNPGFGLSYSYSWTGNFNSQDLNSIAGGTYTVTVSAGGTCTNTTSFNVPDTSNPPQLSANITPAFCGKNIGSINISVNGSQPPFSFKWSNNAQSPSLTNLLSGDYTVTVTGTDGCSTIQTFTVPENTTIPSISASITPLTSCIANNGAITLNVSPPGAYNFVWSNSSNQQNIANLAVGDYTVTVDGGGACIATATFTVNNSTQTVSLSGTPANILCFGNNTGSIDVTIIGGSSPYIYNWSPAQPGNPIDLNNLPPGTYTFSVTDANGCSDSESFSITQPAAALSMSCIALSTVSFPGGADGTANVSVSGGTAPYSLNFGASQPQILTAATTININNLPVGTYPVVITDANGCSTTCQVVIKLINCDTEIGSMESNTLTKCGETCITANYNAAGQFLEPNDVLQFVLHTGNSNTIVGEIARNNQPTFCFLPGTMTYGTTYYVSAIAGNNDGSGNVVLSHWCTKVSSGTPIRFFETPVISVATPEIINCIRKQVFLNATTTIPANLIWSTTNGQIVGAQNTPTITVIKAGGYRLIASNNICADTLIVPVQDVTNNPIATVSANPSDILDCAIDEIVLAGTIEGSLNANAIWVSGGQTFANGTIVQIEQPGTYTFIIIDTLSLCQDTAVIQIDENLAFPPLFINQPATINCTNPTINLTGGSSFPGILFRWVTITGTDTTTLGTTTTLTVTNPGTYYLIGFDPSNRCTNILSTSVQSDKTYPIADAGAGFKLACFGEIGTLDGSASSGANNRTFLWTTTDGAFNSGQTSPNPEIKEPGTYLLVVTNPGNGCTDSDEVLIEPKTPLPALTVVQPPCFGDKGSIVIDSVVGGKPPVNYTVNNGSFTTQTVFTNLNPGIYSIFLTDAVGCSTTINTEIIEPPLFDIAVEPQVQIKMGDSYLINTQVNAPLNEIDQVNWTPSTSLSCDTCLTTIASPLNTTRYNVKVTTLSGCTDVAPIVIYVDKSYDIYVPNTFTPDGDGDNDIFMIFADERAVKTIKSFQVFSRWGETVCQYTNFKPNNPAYGWDGKHRGQLLTPAVFAWYAVVELIDGQEVLLEGDVTIIR